MAGVHFSWNLLDDVRQLFEFPFMVNAFRAGTIVAVASAARRACSCRVCHSWNVAPFGVSVSVTVVTAT